MEKVLFFFLIFIGQLSAVYNDDSITSTSNYKSLDEPRPKPSNTLLNYICHRQPSLSICTRHGYQTKYLPPTYNNYVSHYDSDPMPTPGALPTDEIHSNYNVIRRHEQEEPEEKSVEQEKMVKTKHRNFSDSGLSNSVEKVEQTQETPITSSSDDQPETTTQSSKIEGQTTQSSKVDDQTTHQPLNPRLRFQQYEKAFQDYYRQYPFYHQYYSPQSNYYQQQRHYYYQQPSHYNQQQQPYYYYPQQQLNYYQPSGLNFGIESQLMIPYASPMGLSSNFGFGKK